MTIQRNSYHIIVHFLVGGRGYAKRVLSVCVLNIVIIISALIIWYVDDVFVCVDSIISIWFFLLDNKKAIKIKFKGTWVLFNGPQMFTHNFKKCYHYHNEHYNISITSFTTLRFLIVFILIASFCTF